MRHFQFYIFFLAIIAAACQSSRIARQFPAGHSDASHTGTVFYETAPAFNWSQRDSMAIDWFRHGYIPQHWKRFSKIKILETDSLTGKRNKLQYWVSPDYFSVGSKRNWARVPITPLAAEQMMDESHCLFPTRKIVDQVYAAAKVKLKPVPMYAFRDSTVTMYQHHLIVEGQRNGKHGLIAGIKKDVVTTPKLLNGEKKNRVAIYGWHQLNGKPIQPLYTGHVNWYVDYSHGIRFVSSRMKLNGKWVSMNDILNDPQKHALISDEDSASYVRYH